MIHQSPVPVLPHGQTARRLEWAHLPPNVRDLVARRCGSPVVEARSQGAGFTPGMAAVLVCEDGSRHFVKAASTRAQRTFAASYREEARKLALLPASAPAPALAWSYDGPDWVVLGIEHVEARAPRRPWREADLERCLELTTAMAEVLTPAPPALAGDAFADEVADWPAGWDHVRAVRGDLAAPGVLDEAAGLAARFREVTAGTTLVHTDLRDDNILLCTDGRTLVCDWNWPAVGAAWLDTFFLLLGPRGDGFDVETVLASHPLTREVPAEDVDVLLALVTGYFLKSADDPVPSSSPHLRDHQRWYGQASWAWLAERRGWS